MGITTVSNLVMLSFDYSGCSVFFVELSVFMLSVVILNVVTPKDFVNNMDTFYCCLTQ
jgi:hypothetical protein